MGVDSSNNKRIAKNTIFLYIRMFIIMGVALYTSRVVLRVLGIEDYGIYNIVGGVVSFLAFLRSSFSTSTSRFLSFELGAKNEQRLRDTFSSALVIHFCLMLFLFIILETVGLWFVYNKLTIPDNRMGAALFVYHFSVITCCLQIVQLPFNAAIISHERMGAFAYISIVEVLLKLLIVYLLELGDFDRLRFYAILMFLVTSFISFLYIIYSLRHFQECSLHIRSKKGIVKPMLKFSGWDLYGNLSVAVRGQGINILQNIFFGPIVNAAVGIANQVMHAIMGFATNFMVAVRPQIIKSYASQELERFNSLIINSSKFCTLLLFAISFPFLLEAHFVLDKWLVNVPDYAVVFCQLSIINNWISIMFRPIVYGIHATGSAKQIGIITGTIYLLVLPLSYIFLRMGGSPIVPFVLNILLLLVGHFIFSLYTMKRNVPSFSRIEFLKRSTLNVFVISILSVIPSVCIHYYLEEGWFRLIIVTLIFLLSLIVLVYYMAFDIKHRQLVLLGINKMYKKRLYENSPFGGWFRHSN